MRITTMLQVVLTPILLGCAPSLKTQLNVSPKNETIQDTAPLCPISGTTLLIVPIADGVERKDGPALGSGNAMATEFRSRLLQSGYNAIISDYPTMIGNIENASRYDAKYILKVDIIEWEDNATNWSGKADRVNISAEVYSVESKKLEVSLSLASKSQWATLVDNSPDRLIPLIAKETLSKVFCGIH